MLKAKKGSPKRETIGFHTDADVADGDVKFAAREWLPLVKHLELDVFICNCEGDTSICGTEGGRMEEQELDVIPDHYFTYDTFQPHVVVIATEPTSPTAVAKQPVTSATPTTPAPRAAPKSGWSRFNRPISEAELNAGFEVASRRFE